MSRLPFDPSRLQPRRRKAAAAAAPPAPAQGDAAESSRPLSVAQLAAVIDGALRTGIPGRVSVVGEISGYRERTHLYFDLKDADAVINCVMFATAARRLRFTPGAGHEVVVTGRVEFFAKQGRTQFYVESMEPVGAGALDLEFKRLCEELRALGWFEQERKRPLPRFPRRVAVVTSRSGAALQDVLDTMRRRCPAVAASLVDVRVQGDGAAAEVVRALGWIGRNHAAFGIDAVILTRGGGSKEDLWTFNERAVAEAVLRCPVPVVAAIGHETDTSIAELVADERCATPTQAAMRLTPDAASLGEQLDALSARLGSLVRRQVRHERERLRSAARHPIFTDPRDRLLRARREAREAARRLRAGARERLGSAARRMERLAGALERHRPAAVYADRRADLRRCESRLRAAMSARIACTDPDDLQDRLVGAWGIAAERRRSQAEAARRGLELVGPISVLRRGYSFTRAADGSPLRSVDQAAPGDVIRTRLLDGEIDSVVRPGEGTGEQRRPAFAQTDLPPREPPRPAPRRPARRRNRGRAADAGSAQMDLFGGVG